MTDANFVPRPVQQPRIPIWVAGKWPHTGPFRRAARWDGVCPNALERTVTLAEYQAIQAFIHAHRSSAAPFDIVHMQLARHPQEQPAAAVVAAHAQAGVTWWLAYFDEHSRVADVEQHLRQGPAR